MSYTFLCFHRGSMFVEGKCITWSSYNFHVKGAALARSWMANLFWQLGFGKAPKDDVHLNQIEGWLRTLTQSTNQESIYDITHEFYQVVLSHSQFTSLDLIYLSLSLAYDSVATRPTKNRLESYKPTWMKSETSLINLGDSTAMKLDDVDSKFVLFQGFCSWSPQQGECSWDLL